MMNRKHKKFSNTDEIKVIVVGRSDEPQLIEENTPEEPKKKGIVQKLFDLLPDIDEDFSDEIDMLGQHIPGIISMVEPRAERFFNLAGVEKKTKEQSRLEKIREMIAEEELEILRLKKKKLLEGNNPNGFI